MPTASGRGRGSRVGKGNRRIGVGGRYFRGVPHLRTGGGGRGTPAAMFSATQDVTAALPNLGRRLRSGAMGGGQLGGVNAEQKAQDGDTPTVEETPEGGNRGGRLASLGGDAARPNLGALIKRARRAKQDGEEKDRGAEPPLEFKYDADRAAETQAGPEGVDIPGGRPKVPMGAILSLIHI